MPPQLLNILQNQSAALSSSISSSVASGVLRGVNLVTASVESSVARAQASVMDVFGANSNGASAVEGALGRIDEVATQARGQIVSLVSEATQMLMARLQTMLGAVIGGIQNAFNSILGALSTLPARLFGVMRGVFGGFASALRSGFGTVLGLFRGGGASLPGAGGIGAALVGAVATLSRGIVSTLTGAASGAFGLLSASIRTGAAAVSGVIFGGFGLLKSVLSTLFGALAAVVGGVITAVSTGTATLGAALAAVWPVLLALVGAITTVLAGAAAFITRQLSNGIVLAFRGASALWNSVLVPVASGLADAARGAFAGIGRAFTAVGFVFAPLVSGARQLGALVWGGMQSAAGVIGGWLSSSFSFLQGIGAQVGGMLRGFFATTLPAILSAARAFAVRAFAGLASFAQSAVTALSNFGAGLWGAVTALGTLAVTLTAVGIGAKAIWESAKSAMEFAKTTAQIGARNGLSGAQNAFSLQRFASLGIGRDTAAGVLKQNPFINRTVAGAFGLPGVNSGNFLNAFAAKYGQMMAGGFVSQLLAQNMARVMGVDSDEILALSQLSRAQRQRQTAYSDRINGALGLDPGSMARVGTEVSLALTRVTVGFDALKMKLAQLSLPLVERLLDGVANFIGRNAGRISAFLEMAVSWLFNEAPRLITDSVATLAGFVAGVVDTVIAVGGFLFAAIPGWVTGATQMLAQGAGFLVSLVDTIAGVLTGALEYLSGLMETWAQNILRFGPVVVMGIAQGLLILGDSVSEFLRRLGATLGNFIGATGAMLAGWLSSIGTFIAQIQSDANNPMRRFVLWIADSLDGLLNTAREFAGAMAFISAAIVEAIRNSIPLPMRAAAGAVLGPARNPFAERDRAMGQMGAPTLGQDARNLLDNSPALNAANQWFQNAAANVNAWGQNFGETVNSTLTNAGNIVGERFGALAQGVVDYGLPTVEQLGEMVNGASDVLRGQIPGIEAARTQVKGLIEGANRFMVAQVQGAGELARGAVGTATKFVADNIKPLTDKAVSLSRDLQGMASNGAWMDLGGGFSGGNNGGQFSANLQASLDKFGDGLGLRDGNQQVESLLSQSVSELKEQNRHLRELKSGDGGAGTMIGSLAYMMNAMKDAETRSVLSW